MVLSTLDGEEELCLSCYEIAHHIPQRCQKRITPTSTNLTFKTSQMIAQTFFYIQKVYLITKKTAHDSSLFTISLAQEVNNVKEGNSLKGKNEFCCVLSTKPVLAKYQLHSSPSFVGEQELKSWRQPALIYKKARRNHFKIYSSYFQIRVLLWETSGTEMCLRDLWDMAGPVQTHWPPSYPEGLHLRRGGLQPGRKQTS